MRMAARVSGSKMVKGLVVTAFAAAAIGIAAPISSASNEASWNEGCRGYWYTTSGHGYCNDATNYPSYGYYTNYDCNNEIDEQIYKSVYDGFVGKLSTYECTFKLNKTHVSL